MSTSQHRHRIHVGIGGWSYEPWRETFYPPEVKAKGELKYASRQVTAIEINSTFYRLQTAAVFAKWRDATPDDFVFSLKAPRFVTHRKELALGVDGAKRFVDSGIEALQAKLGPLLWQLPPTYAFSAEDIGAFLTGLPRTIGARPLRHALNVRHASFRNEAFIALARKQKVAVVFEDDAVHPAIADLTGDFVYARLRRSVASVPTGYQDTDLKEWANRAAHWARGDKPTDLPFVADHPEKKSPRDVFIFFINGAKERAPAAARRLIEHLGKTAQPP